MNVERDSATSSLIDVLDRVLDKGIVIDAWVRLSVIGIDLITLEARVIVASFETYLKYADEFAHPSPRTMTVKQIAAGIQLQLSDELPAVPERMTARRRHSRRVRGS